MADNGADFFVKLWERDKDEQISIQDMLTKSYDRKVVELAEIITKVYDIIHSDDMIPMGTFRQLAYVVGGTDAIAISDRGYYLQNNKPQREN